ncbi:MAG TPA: LLM class flavin-dependent oxidoreductase [Solirubrobacterales bacterium]|nr:LLM class flavin-dependent oxidoreductase [Solirubrobacterales bacterium]
MADALDRVQVVALGDSAAELSEGARAAEAAGIEGVWAIELYRSTFTQATWLAAKTEEIGIGTGITWAFTRSPFLLAVSALDIDEMSGGRFRLGLGAGVKRLNERWHGADYGRPAPHLRETVEATRLIMESANAGAPIRYEGSYHDIDIKGWTRPHPAFRDKVPIYVAAVGEGMARMAGDVADGVLGHLICSPRWLEDVMIPNFEKGLSRSGRERSSFDFIPGMCVAIAEDDSELEGAYDAARKTLAFYATVRTYAPVFEIDGFGSEAEAVGNAFRAGDLAGVAAAVSDEMVDTYCAVGAIDQVREKVGRVAGLGDSISLSPPTYFMQPEEIAEYQRRMLEAFGPANL